MKVEIANPCLCRRVAIMTVKVVKEVSVVNLTYICCFQLIVSCYISIFTLREG